MFVVCAAVTGWNIHTVQNHPDNPILWICVFVTGALTIYNLVKTIQE